MKSDGTILLDGQPAQDLQKMESWRNIVAIKTQREYPNNFVGLQTNGRVIAAGMNHRQRRKVKDY